MRRAARGNAMKTHEKLDLVATTDMTQAEFEAHTIAVCVRRLDDSAELRIESIPDSEYASRDELLQEATRSFLIAGHSAESAAECAEQLVRKLLAKEFSGDVWHVRLERAKTLVLVKSETAMNVGVGEVLRAVYSDATSEDALHQARQSDTAGTFSTAG